MDSIYSQCIYFICLCQNRINVVLRSYCEKLHISPNENFIMNILFVFCRYPHQNYSELWWTVFSLTPKPHSDRVLTEHQLQCSSKRRKQTSFLYLGLSLVLCLVISWQEVTQPLSHQMCVECSLFTAIALRDSETTMLVVWGNGDTQM